MANPYRNIFNLGAAGQGPDIVCDAADFIVNNDRQRLLELLDADADQLVDAWYGDKEQKTLLMVAAEHGRRDMAADLIDHGAKIDAAEPLWGGTALDFAILQGHTDVMELLLDRGADVNRHCVPGHSPLAAAVRSGRLEAGRELETARLLLARGADVNYSDPAGLTALMFAAENGQTELCLLMFNKGADFSLRDNLGRDAIAHARAGWHDETAAILEEALRSRDAAIQENEVRNFGAENGLRKPAAAYKPLRLKRI